MLKNWALLFFFCCLPVSLFSQQNNEPVLRFDFNDHRIREANDKISVKPVGVALADDRFGNDRSAIYTYGHATSYLNFGSPKEFKSKVLTLAMWVKVHTGVLSGKGYAGNPFIIVRNGPGEDFMIAYSVGYNYIYNRIGGMSTRDSLKEVIITGKSPITLNTWYHMAITFDDDYFALYINGELDGKVIKGFETKYLEGDSIVLGRTTGPKNERYAHAVFDDICVYHRVLTEKEILELYHEPNPNRLRNILSEALKYGIMVLILGLVIVFLIIRNKRNLKRQKEYYELHNKINELEIKVIKTQMNPHFISNSLAAIQDLIYKKEIENAGQYLAKFSFFLRQVLDYSDKNYTTLEEEITIIKLNIELEQLRFKNNFKFMLYVDENIELREVSIPSLLTQPFIENAIWHGLLPLQERDPHLEVRVYSKNKFIYLEIEDNGVGRPAPSVLTEKKSKGTKLAMDKIDSINRLRESNDYRLEIKDLFDERGQPSGTRIIIELTADPHEE